MPTYAYRCTDCGFEFEEFQRFSDDPLKDCPACTGNVRRLISPVGVVFKGSGWYITDSRQATSSGKGSTNENGASAKSEKSDKDQTSAASKAKTATTEKTPAASTSD